MSVVLATAARMGMAATAVLCTKLHAHYRPKYLAMSGLTAGIRGRVALGDVLVADPSWDWGSGKFEVVDGVSRFAADPIQLDMDPAIRSRLKDATMDKAWLQSIRLGYPGDRPTHELNAHVEGVASGAAVLGDDLVVEQVKEQSRKLFGIEMEIYGMMTAAHNSSSPKPIAFSAKAVCDFADTTKNDDYRHYANWVSAQFVYQFALRHLTR